MQYSTLLLLFAGVALGREVGTLGKRNEAPPTNGTEYQGDCKWTNLGCYEEPVGSDIVPYRYSDTALTPQSCLAHCDSLNYNFALLEYRSECWCGFTADTSAGKWNGTGTGCRLACSGDSSQWCGGQSKGQLFQKNTDTSACGSTTTSTPVTTCIPVTLTATESAVVTTTVSDTTTTTSTITESEVATATTTITWLSTATITTTDIDTSYITVTTTEPTTISFAITETDTTTTTEIVTSVESIYVSFTTTTTAIETAIETETTTATDTTTITRVFSVTTTVPVTIVLPTTIVSTTTIVLPTTIIPITTSQPKETVTVTDLKTQTASITVTTTIAETCKASTTSKTSTTTSPAVCTATIDNSSFEQESDDSWSLYKSGSTNYIDGDFSDASAHTGSKSYRFAFQKQSSIISYLTLKQDVTLCSGKKYTVTGWTKRPVAACGCIASFYLDGALVAVSNNDSSSGWAQIKAVTTIKARNVRRTAEESVSASSSSSVKTLKVTVLCPSRHDNVAELFLDDVSLVAS